MYDVTDEESFSTLNTTLRHLVCITTLACTNFTKIRVSLFNWTTGFDHWTGLLEWTTGLDYWSGLLDLDRTTGLADLDMTALHFSSNLAGPCP